MIVIIGAGVAGLTCAWYLKERGVEALVLEASDGVGGRVRTDAVNGFQLDRGFQVFLTSYPEARKILDYDALRLKNICSGAKIRSGADFFVLPNPLKQISAAPQAVLSPAGNLWDKIKVLQLSLDTRNAADPAEANLETNQSTISFLRNYGYSEQIINRFFVPFFRGVFLERELHTRASFFQFLYSQFAASDVTLPENGIQAIPAQIAAGLSAHQIRLNTPVQKIDGQKVYLENGEILAAAQIVLATDAESSARLLGEKSTIEFNSTICLYFETDWTPKLSAEPYLFINSNRDELIDHLLVVSNVAPSYAPPGKTLLSVNLVNRSNAADDVLIEKVRAELGSWFGAEVIWRHLKTYNIASALPKYFADSELPRNLKINDFTFRCGDYTAYPSLNAAMKTGREAAEMLMR